MAVIAFCRSPLQPLQSRSIAELLRRTDATIISTGKFSLLSFVRLLASTSASKTGRRRCRAQWIDS